MDAPQRLIFLSSKEVGEEASGLGAAHLPIGVEVRIEARSVAIGRRYEDAGCR
jgi:hypothetical protein